MANLSNTNSTPESQQKTPSGSSFGSTLRRLADALRTQDRPSIEERGKILEVKAQHGTRIFVVYEDREGKQYTNSVHQSGSFRCQDITLNPHDFLKGRFPYGKFDQDAYTKLQGSKEAI